MAKQMSQAGSAASWPQTDPNWLVQNAEWVFGDIGIAVITGIGITVILGVAALIARRRRRAARQDRSPAEVLAEVAQVLRRHGVGQEVRRSAVKLAAARVRRGANTAAEARLLQGILATNGFDDVNAKDGDGRTPVHYAAFAGDDEVVDFLLANGADVNAKDNEGSTPLDLAAEKGHTNVVNLLTSRGADVNSRCGVYGTTTRHAQHIKPILSELCRIAARDSHSEKDREARRSRVRELGYTLHQMGGFKLMTEICEMVRARTGGGGARIIEAWWDGIGDWQG